MREPRDLKRFFGQMKKNDLLILDKLGYVPFSKAGAELLFEIVSRAYERLSLILTTNLPFEQWTEVMGSERLTGAMLDRLTHRVHILEANGESDRLQDARKRHRKSNGSKGGGLNAPPLSGRLVSLRAPHRLERGHPRETTVLTQSRSPIKRTRELIGMNPHTRGVKPVGGTWQQGGFRHDPALRRIGMGNRCR
jgi:hypothetical protein